jgi:hypothetical protein
MKRVYSIFAVVWLLTATLVVAVVGAADGQQVPPSCGSAQQPWMGE